MEARLEGEPEALEEAKRRFRSEICGWFDKSWFMHRARVKPRGYPGDYLTLVAIYDNVPKSRGFGGYLDLYFLNTALARGVRARMQGALQFLQAEMAHRQGGISVLNVACGPFREYTTGIRVPRHCQMQVVCVDYDQEALDYVADVVAGNPRPDDPQVTCVRYNALRMCSARKNIEIFGRPDIIYSVGLFDYLPDKNLIPMLAGLRETVNENGVVYAAFKDCLLYDKTEYQWHVDWYFYQRTEEECRNLFVKAGYDMDVLETTRDSTGVIINFLGRTKPTRINRVDKSEPVQIVPRTLSGDAAARQQRQ
jgi:SAM-dependent methyltransferase